MLYREYPNSTNTATANGKENNMIKYARSIAMAVTAVCLAGCASAPHVVRVDPVGPAPSLGSSGAGDGSLVVYSARETAFVDLNLLNRTDSMFEHRSDFRHERAHTSYTVYAKDGQIIHRVANAEDVDDATPSIVTLPAGAYQVEADAIDCHGQRIAVMVPVVVRAGQLTEAHLEGGWHPAVPEDAQLAKLPCGRPIGWRAPESEFASAATARLN
jgi:hypothetical protein